MWVSSFKTLHFGGFITAGAALSQSFFNSFLSELTILLEFDGDPFISLD